MFGIALIWLGAFFEEISSVAGKREFAAHRENIYVYGFLQMLMIFLIFVGILVAMPREMLFSWSSLPTLSLRIVFEVLLQYIGILTLKMSQRTTLGIVRSGTIPILLVVDIFMGYAISTLQFIGILALFALAVFAVKGKVVNRKGLKLVIISTLIPVITATIYKYDITYFNSMAVEGAIVHAFQLLFWAALCMQKKNNPFAYLRDRQIIVQMVSVAVASMAYNIAFVFTIPSMLIAVKRASVIFWSTLSGVYIFSEKKAHAKFAIAGLMMFVIIAMI